MESRETLVKNWFLKAENDLKNAKLIFIVDADEKPYDTVCFHCQQAAEKYLKGFLVLLDISFPKTHNIEVLIDLLSTAYPTIIQFSQAVSLSYYAVENRYPDDFIEIPESEARLAYKIAEDIKAFVLEKSKGYLS